MANYEFDAPCHVMDFNNPHLDTDDEADRWFDADDDVTQWFDTTASNLAITPNRSGFPFGTSQKLDLPRAVVTPQVKEPLDSAPSGSSSPPSNIVTSWGNRAATGLAAGNHAPSHMAVKQQNTSAQFPVHARRVSKRKSDTSDVVPVKKRRSQPLRRSEATPRRAKCLGKRSTIRSSQRKTGFPRRSQAAPPVQPKGSEEQGPEHIRRLQMKVAEHRKKNDASYEAALSGSHLPPPTVPKEFNFSTAGRAKAAKQRGHIEEERGMHAAGQSPKKTEQLKMTGPHSPRLMTHQRKRLITVKSSAEMETEELDKLNKARIKALVLKRKILKGVVNPKKTAAKGRPIPEGLDLQMEKRIHERQATKKTEEHHAFHAQPLPTKILEGVVGVPPKKVILATIAESPDFALKKRVKLEHKVEVKAPSPIKAKPMPHFSAPVYTCGSNKSEVEVCPFSFDEREKEKKILREKMLEDLRNKEVQQFKAQLLPDFNEVHLPQKKMIEPTKPEPFKLQIDERGEAKNNRWEQMVKEEQKRQLEATVFRAQPSKIVHKEPFQPKKESYTVLVPGSFELATERRARERQEFERELIEKEALRAYMQRRERQEQEEREKEELAKMRQDQVHKAQPVRRYKAVIVKKSDVPCTVAQSPKFSDRFRS